MTDKLEQATTAPVVVPAVVESEAQPPQPAVVVMLDDRGDEVRAAAQNIEPPAMAEGQVTTKERQLAEDEQKREPIVQREVVTTETEKHDPRDNPITRAGESIEHGSVAGAFTNLGEDVARGSTAKTASAYAGAAKDALSDVAQHREEVATEQGERSMTAPIVGAAASGAESFERGRIAGAMHDLGESVAHGKVAQIAAAAGEKIKMAGEKIGAAFDREHRGRAGEPSSAEPPRTSIAAFAKGPTEDKAGSVGVTTATIHEQAMAPLQRVEEAQEMQYPPENHPALEGARISRTLHTTPEDPARPPPPVVAGAKEKAVSRPPRREDEAVPPQPQETVVQIQACPFAADPKVVVDDGETILAVIPPS